MTEQSYSNYSRYVPGYHFILTSFLLFGFIGSIVNICYKWDAPGDLLGAALIALLFVCCMFLFYFVRQFPLRAQDRVIRAEETLRYFILTGKQLDKSITMSQVIALRFASDDEFIALADRAVGGSLSPKEIKQQIKNWRADNHRM